jgi:hypothetical protein
MDPESGSGGADKGNTAPSFEVSVSKAFDLEIKSNCDSARKSVSLLLFDSMAILTDRLIYGSEANFQ